jgi:nucleotide-binding universal stress UspA family protein
LHLENLNNMDEFNQTRVSNQLKNKTILVPWDFSATVENALEYAVNLAKIAGNPIILIHIVADSKKLEIFTNDLTEIARTNSLRYGIEISAVVRKSRMPKAIVNIAKELNVGLIIMKTDGIKGKGRQKYFGSRALKIIYGSSIPFIVVQEAPKNKEINKVVCPVDFRWENKEIFNWIYFLYDISRPELFIFTSSGEDKRIKNNLSFARKSLEYKSIDYKIVQAEGKENFSVETIHFAEKINADLIIIMFNRNISFLDFLFGSKEQYIITNSNKIPVMCLNPRTDLRKYAGFR